MIDLGQAFVQYFTVTEALTERLRQSLDEQLMDTTDLAICTMQLLKLNRDVQFEVKALMNDGEFNLGNSPVYQNAAARVIKMQREVETIIDDHAANDPNHGKERS